MDEQEQRNSVSTLDVVIGLVGGFGSAWALYEAANYLIEKATSIIYQLQYHANQMALDPSMYFGN